MKQVLSGRGGTIEVVDSPAPGRDRLSVTITTEYSLISSGTERATLARSGSPMGLARRAITDPALRAKATQRLRTNGAGATLEEARSRAAKPRPLGYSAAGRVLTLGSGVHDLHIGQRVAAAGAGYANHAEVISVPRPLVTPIPDAVSSMDAAYVTLGAIAMHGHRLGAATLGDAVAVVGLGLVGQLSVQLAAAAGCRVFGTDPNPTRCRRAAASVADGQFHPLSGDFAASLSAATGDVGVDVVIVTAATANTKLVNQCLRFLRERGRLVIVGEVPMALERDLMYQKEIEVVVSRSYGPGRYDRAYEERGADYPVGQVRWTQGRNFGAFLDLIARKRVSVASLTTAVIPVVEAPRAYELAAQPDEHLGVILSYPPAVEPHGPGSTPDEWSPGKPTRPAGMVLNVALVGPGSFATSVLRPAMARIPELVVAGVVAHNSADARGAAALFRAPQGTTELDEVLQRQDVDAVVIATRHDTHAAYARRALEAGKHVFVEKPLGLTIDECRGVVEAAAGAGQLCMVNFNRRFSPHARLLREDIGAISSGVTVMYRVNSGQLPLDHWTRDPVAGGGRVLGEAVHFLDFVCWLFDESPNEVAAVGHGVGDPFNEMVCTLGFARGRCATIVYTTSGSSRVGKERIEVLGGGHTWTNDDFTTTQRDGRTLLKGRQAKGHREALRHFVDAALGRTPLSVTANDGLRATQLALRAQNRLS